MGGTSLVDPCNPGCPWFNRLRCYVGGLILDNHVQSAVSVASGPIRSDIHRVDGDVQEVKALVHVLQAQFAAGKYSAVPVKDLKGHRDELDGVKSKLASVPSTTPGYWPVAFQIISLASKATSDVVVPIDKPEGSIEDVISNRPGAIAPLRN